MINKIIIFFLIISNLIFFNVYSNDQISFDVTEIEILDDCGHFLHLEKADEFNKKLLNFFADS